MNRFTKLISRIIVASLLLAVSGTVLAQDNMVDGEDSMTRERHHQRGKQSMPGVTNMMRAIRHLELSDDQKASFKEIMRGLRVEERLLAKEMKAGHEQLKELIKAESFDQQAVAAVAENEGALAAERLILASRAMSDVYGQLTDEQRAELEIMATERAAKRNKPRREKREEKQEQQSAAEG